MGGGAGSIEPSRWKWNEDQRACSLMDMVTSVDGPSGPVCLKLSHQNALEPIIIKPGPYQFPTLIADL